MRKSMRTSNRRRSTLLAYAISAALGSTLLPLVLQAQEATEATETTQAVAAEPEASSGEEVTELSDLSVTDDPMRALSNEPTASSFGFTKPPLETPRTVSFVSEEQMNLF